VSYRAKFSEQARAQLRAVELKTARRILAKLTQLQDDPFGYATTELVDRPGVRRLHIGDYRVFYTVDRGELIVLVIRVAHR
jgi:mRNA interferase RelE/StbE